MNEPAPPPSYAWLPYVNQQQRVQMLYPELRRLSLERHIAEFAMRGYKIVPPELVAPASYVDALRDAVLRVSDARTGIAHKYEAGSTHTG